MWQAWAAKVPRMGLQIISNIQIWNREDMKNIVYVQLTAWIEK